MVHSLVDALHQAIRARILNSELPGGARLTEKDIAEQYSVARPTAKAAVERLVHEGLLRRSTNKTATVPQLTVADVDDLYYSRGFIEREVMTAVAAAGEVPRGAREALTRLQSLAEEPEPMVPEVVESDLDFHRALVDSLGSARLSRLYDSLMGEVHLCMAQVQSHGLLHPGRIAEEHAAILDAIRAKDGERAVAQMNAHLEHARERLTDHLTGEAGAARS
jgi:DNA-binding GntR family transcriptional regulator